MNCLLELNDGCVAGVVENNINIYNVTTGEQVKQLKDTLDSVKCLVLLKDAILACGIETGQIKIWNNNFKFF